MSEVITGLYTAQYYQPNYPVYNKDPEWAESIKNGRLNEMMISHLARVIQPEKPVVIYRMKDQEHTDPEGNKHWKRSILAVYLRTKDAGIGDYIFGENIPYRGDRYVTIYHPETGGKSRWMAHYIGLEDGKTNLCWERLS